MIKNKFKSIYTLSLTGLNFEKLFKICIDNNIELNNIERREFNKLIISLNFLDYKKFIKKTKNFNYKIEILNITGIARLKTALKKQMGVFVGLIISLFLILVVNNITFNYTFLGLKTISKETIEQVITDFGIKKYSFNNFNNEELERFLKDNILQISMVSVQKKGTTLIVNIKEKLPEPIKEFDSIIAPANMIITNVEVFAGTCAVKAGDIVFAGEILVHPYYLDNGNILKCEPKALIEGDTWYCAQTVFESEKTVLQKTGNKIEDSAYVINNKIFWEIKNKNSFENFEIENKEILTTNSLFLPIIIKKTIYHELKYADVIQDFNDHKDKLINEVKKIAYEKVPINQKVLEENVIITQNGNIYFVNCFLSSKIIISGFN